MFPKPIEKSHRAWQIGYQALLPIAMLLWLAPLLAVALFSIRPDSDFSIGNYWGWPTSFEMIENYMMVFTSSMPRYRLHLRNRNEATSLSRGAPLLKSQDLQASGAWLMAHGVQLPYAMPGSIWVVEGRKL